MSAPLNYSSYRKLARQVSCIRWLVPPALTAFVFAFEFTEHVFVHESDLSGDFFLELILFGALGPILIAFILTWIVRNLRELEQVHQAIHALNAELERKVELRTQELARANDELRELDRLKSEFVALVSHELRAPLTNIQGGLELVLSRDNVCPPVYNNLKIIQSEVRRLTRLVQRILDVSVIDSGQLTLNLGPTALRPLLRHVVEQVSLATNDHTIVLDVPAQPQLVIADEERLIDIVTSLLQNAIKYSPGGGQIRIGLRFDSDYAYVSIKDQGVGISPQDIPHLTQKFYRGHLSNQSSGYGLGLYFVNKLIEAQAGWLEIESEGVPGQGATFTFSLPLEKETLYELDTAY